MSVRSFDANFWRKHVKSDCEELLVRFQRTQSVRFEVFATIWREMDFSQIFWGTRNHKRRLFCRLVLDTVYGYFLPPFSFQIRVGGLYLLYSLYHSQTTRPSEQIRLALKDWDDVKKFERDAVDAQHMDAVFVLRQLMMRKAFFFTAMPTVLTYEKKGVEDRSVLCEDFVERASRPQELIGAELLEELSNINNLYAQMKTSIVSQRMVPAESSVNLIHKDLVSQLHSTVLDFYSWQRGQETAAENETSQEGTSSLQESCSRAKLLASIKSKAYGEAAEVSKSRRHRQVEMSSTPEETKPVLTSTSTRTIKPSLKNRTSDTLPISEPFNWTRVSHLSSLESISEKEPQKKKHLE